MTAEERAKQVAIDYAVTTGDDSGILSTTLIGLIEKAIVGAMKDQRHACAEAVITAVDLTGFPASSGLILDRARMAAMNAEPK